MGFISVLMCLHFFNIKMRDSPVCVRHGMLTTSHIFVVDKQDGNMTRERKACRVAELKLEDCDFENLDTLLETR